MENIRNWYEMTLAQMASDSYLDNLVSLETSSVANNPDLGQRLRQGGIML